jgi:hypothetical protein
MTPTTTQPASRTRRVLASLAFVALVAVMLGFTSAVLKPGRTAIVGGGPWHSFLSLPRNSTDAMFFGNSHVFAGVDPATVWRGRGIPTFVLGGPMQQMPVTYYYLREALKTQSPKVVALEVSGASYDQARFNAQFHELNLGYMPWSENRLGALLFATPDGQRTSSLVDLWVYHGRWSQLTKADFNLMGKDSGYEYLKGFTPRPVVTDTSTALAEPYVLTPAAKARADKALAFNMPALKAIAELCHDRGIQLVLFLTPTKPTGGYSYYLDSIVAGVKPVDPDVQSLDLSLPGAVPGLSLASDFNDEGHVAYTGAEKVSAVLANHLASLGLPDRRGEAAYRSWFSDALKRDDYIERRIEPRNK